MRQQMRSSSRAHYSLLRPGSWGNRRPRGHVYHQASRVRRRASDGRAESLSASRQARTGWGQLTPAPGSRAALLSRAGERPQRAEAAIMLREVQKTTFDRSASVAAALNLRITPGSVKEVVMADLVCTLAVADANDSGGCVGDCLWAQGLNRHRRAILHRRLRWPPL